MEILFVLIAAAAILYVAQIPALIGYGICRAVQEVVMEPETPTYWMSMLLLVGFILILFTPSSASLVPITTTPAAGLHHGVLPERARVRHPKCCWVY